MDKSVKKMWLDYMKKVGKENPASFDELSTWHFSDNKEEADELARLVKKGEKKATAPSLWELKSSGEKIPEAGDLHIITDWNGVAQCIIETTSVEIVPFNEVTEEHASREGEGDGSLEYWRKVHRDYYKRVLSDTEYEFREDMPVICEQFHVVYIQEDS